MHVDIKKLGPDGGEHPNKGLGYTYLHHAVEDYSRLAYSEILANQRNEAAAGSRQHAQAFFTAAGVTVTDHGCYLPITPASGHA